MCSIWGREVGSASKSRSSPKCGDPWRASARLVALRTPTPKQARTTRPPLRRTDGGRRAENKTRSCRTKRTGRANEAREGTCWYFGDGWFPHGQRSWLLCMVARENSGRPKVPCRRGYVAFVPSTHVGLNVWRGCILVRHGAFDTGPND